MHLTAIDRFVSYRNGLTRSLQSRGMIIRVMKITAFILLVGCLQVSAIGKSQNVTLNVKNASLESVFKEIRKQTGFNFLFNSEDLRKAKPITVQVTNKPV